MRCVCVRADRYSWFVEIEGLFFCVYLIYFSWLQWHIKLSNMTYSGLIYSGLCTGRTGIRFLVSNFNPLKPSGHYMYRTVVTICTTSLTLQNSTFCPHSVFMCFVWISEQTAIISLFSINWLVCIIEEWVYCSVLAGALYITLESPVVIMYPNSLINDDTHNH
jgi:hypothetical protein